MIELPIARVLKGRYSVDMSRDSTWEGSLLCILQEAENTIISPSSEEQGVDINGLLAWSSRERCGSTHARWFTR